MKKLNLKLNGMKKMLSREQMKTIVGGYNPNCKGLDYDLTWYCCAGGEPTKIGYMKCEEADAKCDGLITNDPTRC